MEGSKKIYKYIFWYVRIFAWISFIAAILLMILGTLLDINEKANSYTFDAGLVLITLSACLLSGIARIKKKKPYGEVLVTIGAACFVIAAAAPLFQMSQLMEGWSGPILLLLIWIMMTLPFLFLTVFIWRNDYKNS